MAHSQSPALAGMLADRSGMQSADCLTGVRSEEARADVDGRGRPPEGYFTKRLAEDWPRSLFEDAAGHLAWVRKNRRDVR